MCRRCASGGGKSDLGGGETSGRREVTSRGSDRPEEAENAGEQNVCSCKVVGACPRQHKRGTKCDQPIARGVFCERCICSCDGACAGACEGGVPGACLRGGRRAKKGMCFTCARGGGKPIKKVNEGRRDRKERAEAAGTKKVSLEEYKALLADAKKEGVYM